MLDRQQLEAVLQKRFPGSTPEQIAAAVNAIMAMIRGDGKPAGTAVPAPKLRSPRSASGLPFSRP